MTHQFARLVRVMDGDRIDNVVPIDQGIPRPDRSKKRNGPPPKWPIRQLAIGESFFAARLKTSGAMYTRAKQLGIRIETEARVERGIHGLRVWRIA